MNILCFGDSNTYGYIPNSGKRYNSNVRWSGILKSINGVVVTEAGCNNRTCGFDNPCGENETGYKAIKKYLDKKFDIIIVSIGINDLQSQYCASRKDIERNFNNFIKIIKANHSGNILVLIPPKLSENILKSGFSYFFDNKSIELSHDLPNIYKNIAEFENCDYIELDKIIKITSSDGLHYEENDHKIVAETVIEYIRKVNNG